MLWLPYYNVLVLQVRAHKHLRRMQTKAGLKKRTPGIRCCTLLQLCLALTYHGDRQLDCSWPLTCALCSARSDFIVGKYEMGPGEGSWLGQEGTPYSEASYLRVTLGILPWHSFQPLRCLVHPPWRFNLPPQDWCIPAGHGAWVVPRSPPLSIFHNWRKEREEKCSEGLWPSEHNVSVDVGRCGPDTYLPLTFTAVKAQHFAILWSAQRPGEDASLTRPLDGTDKHRGWTDLALTPKHQSYILTTKATLTHVHCTVTIIYWASLTHSRWKAYTHFENKYKCTPKHQFTLVDGDIQ